MQIHIYADYGQVCLFDPHVEGPFNDWDEVHNRQGFSWRRRSVSFAVPDEQHQWTFQLKMSPFERNPSLDYLRIISVPLTVGAAGLEIGGVFTSSIYDVSPGTYNLTFALFRANGELQGSFDLNRTSEEVEARIILKDALLDPPLELNMIAVPASGDG